MGRNPASASSSEPQVSVIIVNHNRAELLLDCLQSITAQTCRNLEILIVDNGSSDHSERAAKSLADARIVWVALDRNLGFAGGCNVGIRRARGEFVALLNNDAIAKKDWIEQLMGPMLDDPDTGMCASKILFHGEEVIDKAGHLIYLDGQNRGRGTGERDSGQYDRPEETLFPDGCAALYRRELMLQVGGFDEEFFAYGDDADLGIRIRLLGPRCQYVPEAIVYHRHSSTLGSYSPQKIFWVERNRFWLAIKSFPFVLLVLNPFFTAARWAWNLAAFLSRVGPAGNYRRKESFSDLAGAIFRAYMAGLAGAPRMFKKRSSVRRMRCLSDVEFIKLLWRFRISAKRLAYRDR
jgi:GT2 family glycosyltransferase